MARFSISAHDNDGKCRVCGAHVSEMHYEGCELKAIRDEIIEMRLIIKQFLKLLGVETITSAFAKIAAEQSVHADLKPVCPTCKGTGSVEYPCPNCRVSKAASSR